jgi:hypothetical protein
VPEIYRHNNTKVIFHFCLTILTPLSFSPGVLFKMG